MPIEFVGSNRGSLLGWGQEDEVRWKAAAPYQKFRVLLVRTGRADVQLGELSLADGTPDPAMPGTFDLKFKWDAPPIIGPCVLRIEYLNSNGEFLGHHDDDYTIGQPTWQVPSDYDTSPVGSIFMFAGESIPAGYLNCDGRAVSRGNYAELFAAIGVLWGPGDGATTFNLPDLRGRAGVGAGAGPGLTARQLAQKFGAETHRLSKAELPAHKHSGTTGSSGAHKHNITIGNGGHSHTASTSAAGAHAHGGTTGGGKPTNFFRVVNPNNSGGSLNIASNHVTGWFGGKFSDVTNSAEYPVSYHQHDFRTGDEPAHSHPVSVDTGGEHSHSSTISEFAAHTHAFDTGTEANELQGTGHENMQPGAVVNFIIRARANTHTG